MVSRKLVPLDNFHGKNTYNLSLVCYNFFWAKLVILLVFFFALNLRYLCMLQNFKHIMKELQGAIIISSVFQAILGYSGLMTLLLRYEFLHLKWLCHLELFISSVIACDWSLRQVSLLVIPSNKLWFLFIFRLVSCIVGLMVSQTRLAYRQACLIEGIRLYASTRASSNQIGQLLFSFGTPWHVSNTCLTCPRIYFMLWKLICFGHLVDARPSLRHTWSTVQVWQK